VRPLAALVSCRGEGDPYRVNQKEEAKKPTSFWYKLDNTILHSSLVPKMAFNQWLATLPPINTDFIVPTEPPLVKYAWHEYMEAYRFHLTELASPPAVSLWSSKEYLRTCQKNYENAVVETADVRAFYVSYLNQTRVDLLVGIASALTRPSYDLDLLKSEILFFRDRVARAEADLAFLSYESEQHLEDQIDNIRDKLTNSRAMTAGQKQNWHDLLNKRVSILNRIRAPPPKNLCLICGVDMGDQNPRQLCAKSYCPMEITGGWEDV